MMMMMMMMTMTMTMTNGSAPSPGAPPLWIVIVVQIVSVIGDTLGQRAQRKVFRSSSRRMLTGLTIVSCLQIFLVLTTLQLAWPSITAAVYDGSEKLTCYEEVDMDGHAPSYCYGDRSAQCHVITCPPQGPLSIIRSITLHPLLLLNGVQSVGYYIGEVLLYDDPLGLVFIVMAAMASSLVIAPFETLFGIVDKTQSALVILLGTVGAILCVFEIRRNNNAGRRGTPPYSQISKHTDALIQRHIEGDTGVTSETTGVSSASAAMSVPIAIANEHHQQSPGFMDDEISHLTPSNSLYLKMSERPEHFIVGRTDDEDFARRGSHSTTAIASQERECDFDFDREQERMLEEFYSEQSASTYKRVCNSGLCQRLLRVGLPFVFLALVYSTWFVSQKLFNNEFRLNAWGYTSLDQVLGPLYLLPTLWVIDYVRPLRQCLVPKHEKDDRSSLGDAIRRAFAEMRENHWEGLITVFVYRLLINARAIAYFYLAIKYELSLVYLELQLTRVVMSWIGSFLLIWGVPGFIRVTAEERATVLYAPNVGMKLFGTGLIVLALSLVKK